MIKNGLDLYLRLHGSTRKEYVYLEMREASGPWSKRIWTGQYLLLLFCYRYNVATVIRRCNEHDFVHMWLHYMYYINLLLQELYVESVYP
jgi:hypothetical protein